MEYGKENGESFLKIKFSTQTHKVSSKENCVKYCCQPKYNKLFIEHLSCLRKVVGSNPGGGM